MEITINTGVSSMPNSGMTLHTLVHSCDSFSLHCNSINRRLSIASKSNSHISLTFACNCIKAYEISNSTSSTLCSNVSSSLLE